MEKTLSIADAELLLLENVVFLLLRHGLGLRCAWEEDVAEDAEHGERDAEAGVDALVRQIAVQEDQQHSEAKTPQK